MAARQSMLETALRHASHGWRVFPVMAPTAAGTCPCGNPTCGSPGKHPRIKGWQTKASADPDVVAAWWRQYPHDNIGIATGRESNLLVLDADGGAGMLAVEERGLSETPPSVRTGRVDGGTHFYFTDPEGIDARNFAGKVKGLDVRGNGGYVIAAGSKHASGATYQWANHIDDWDPPEPPKWLIDLLTGNGPTKDGDNTLQGGRNATLFAQARRLRAVDGYGPDALFDIIWAYNLEHCKPPLETDEVKQVVDNACKAEYEAGPDLTAELRDKEFGLIDIVAAELRTYPRTEIGNAEIFVKLFGHNFKYVSEFKLWHVWSGSHWAEDKSNAARRAMMLTIRARASAAAFIPDKDERGEFFQWARSQESASKIDGALKAAAALNSVVASAEQFDRHPTLLGMHDGTYNLVTDAVATPDRADMLTRRIGSKWSAEAGSALWAKTIDEVFLGDCEIIDYFQRAVGYSLTGSNQEQCLFICHGGGANGKSTVLGTIRDMMGDYGASARYETFSSDRGVSVNGDDIAALRGRRFVLVVEPDAGAKLAEGRVKQITGGSDLVTCRHLYGKDFSYLPEFKIWMAVNHMPRIRGTDDGIWRRIHLLPFLAKFDADKMDRQLSAKLAAELPGVLQWALVGMERWRSLGLRPPAKVIKATAEYRHDEDVVQLWMDDCAVEDPTAKTPSAELYMSYVNWCGENGQRQMSANYFSKRLDERGYRKTVNAKTHKALTAGLAVNEMGMG